MSKDVTRLFKQFHPSNYTISLTPDREAATFTGSVTIIGQKVGRPSQRLTFHQKGLKITSTNIVKIDKKLGGQEVPVARVNLHKSYDEVRLHTEALLYPGEYIVTFEFSGKITRPMDGVYPCFFEHDGKQKQLIATQFESHHAREAFPCIDEPEAKATFDLSLVTPAKEPVLANTPVLKQTTEGNLQTTTFETTPKMSTYLLAFVYGDMGYKEATTKDGVVVRTYATPDNVQFTDFALDVAVKCLEFYNDYFGLKYPLPKCDLVALPDFAAGAMENWGCVTFREQCMLVDPKNTSLPMKQYVAMVVAHELAHQWFGNLVTMRWWTDLWLNEGFASWVEYLALDKLFPKWNMWTQFIVDDQQPALRLDALENTHPIEVAVHHPDEIRSIFDAISYNKGASVIHMLHEYLGAEKFRDGLRHYLKTHAYGNTDTVDLWNALAEISGQPVQDFMHAWTSQPGFPVVKAEVGKSTLTATQQRFYANPAQPKDEAILWPIPTKATTSLEPALLSSKEHTWLLKDSTEVFKLNSGQSGFYRTVYDSAHVAQLGEAVVAGTFDPIDRLGILSDVFEAAKAGYSSSVDALELLQAYTKEDNNAVWDVISGGLGGIRAVMDDETLRNDMKPFIRSLVAKQFKRLGWEEKPGEVYFDSLLRPTILGLAALAEEPSVVTECLRLFDAAKKPEDLPADLRGVIYSTAVRNGDKKTFDKLLMMYKTTTLSEEKTTLCSALTGFKQPTIIAEALKVITTDAVRLQDVGYWVAYSFMNRHARHATWKWMTAHWDWLSENLGSDMSFSRFPLYSARSFTDPTFVQEYKDFFEPRLNPGLERAYKQGLETIEWQAAWKKRDLAAIKTFFKA